MSVLHRTTLLCSYRYDPLDRLVGSLPDSQASVQRFYCRSRLATEIQGSGQCSIFQHAEHLLAQQQYHDAKVASHLLVTDTQRSVFTALDGEAAQQFAYSPYGHRPSEHDAVSLPGFNGERLDPFTRHYHLGNGYRQFNPVLMRFNSPDSWSPFGKGGLNAYAYCEGDPRNWSDETGHGRLKSTAPKRLSAKAKTTTKAKRPMTASDDEAASAASARAVMTYEERMSHYRGRLTQRRKEIGKLVKEGEYNELKYQESHAGDDRYVSFNLKNYSDAEVAEAYAVARRDYDFERFPDPEHVFKLSVPNGPVDVAHYDVVIEFVKRNIGGFVGFSYEKRINLMHERFKMLRDCAGINFIIRTEA